MASWTEIMTSQPLYQNPFILRRPKVANFADIIKIPTKRLNKLEIMCWNAIYICISWFSKICWFSVKECWCQQNSSGMSRDLYIFFDLLWVRYNCPKCHYRKTYFREGAFLVPTIREQPRKKGTSSIRLKSYKAFQITLRK